MTSTLTINRRSPFTRAATSASLLLAAATLAACGASSADPDTGDSNIDTDELSDVLTDAQERLAESQQAASTGSGNGTISIQGVDYTFESETCIVSESGFDVTGLGTTADGVAYWASIEYFEETRAEMEAAGLPPANIDAFFGDKDSIDALVIEVQIGKLDNFTSAPDGLPDFRVDEFNVAESETVSVALDGNTITGSGQASDYSGLAIPFNETRTLNFTATCSSV